jgi:replicative superfamily II helicase
MSSDPQKIKKVVQWILEANSETDIREAIRQQMETRNKKEEDEYITKAVEEITAIGKESEDFVRGWTIAATKEIVRKMIEIGDYANALRGIKQVEQLAK